MTCVNSSNVSNIVSFVGDYEPYRNRPETYIVPVIFTLIFIIGIFGNASLILIFVKHKKTRNIPNTYIFSLAFGDLILILTGVPFTSTVYTLESWPFGLVVCKLAEFVRDLSVGVSVFTLMALSAERYYVIVSPMRGKFSGPKNSHAVTCFTAFAIWVISILLAIPAAWFARLNEEKLPDRSVILYCYPFPGNIGEMSDKIFVVTKFLVYYAIPLCAITVFYVLMAIHLVHSANHMPAAMHTDATSKQIRVRKNVAKMVLAFVMIFVICFLPYHAFMLWFHLNPYSLDEYDDVWHTIRIIGFCLSYLNSCINPVTLYSLSGTFRKHFNKLLFPCFGHRQSAVKSTT